MTTFSTWLGILTYSLAVGVAIVWIGISLANWLAQRSVCALLLGLAATCWAIFFLSLTIIASDWLPQFSGYYVALAIRLSGFAGVMFLIGFTVLYLHRKRVQDPR